MIKFFVMVDFGASNIYAHFLVVKLLLISLNVGTLLSLIKAISNNRQHHKTITNYYICPPNLGI